MVALPEGTVTFLFTDIEGSTTLWEQHPDLMVEALGVHNQVLHQAIEAHGGVIFRLVGDAFYAAFSAAPRALAAAVAGQRGLAGAEWNKAGPLKVRMGIHSGEAYPNQAGDYDAHAMNRVARDECWSRRIILLSETSARLRERNSPGGIELLDLGKHRMKGMAWLEHLYQVRGSGLEKDFAPLRTLEAYPHNLPAQLTSFLGRERRDRPGQTIG